MSIVRQQPVFGPPDFSDDTRRLAAMACYDLVKRILDMPNGREMLDAQTSKRETAKAAARKGVKA